MQKSDLNAWTGQLGPGLISIKAERQGRRTNLRTLSNPLMERCLSNIRPVSCLRATRTACLSVAVTICVAQMAAAAPANAQAISLKVGQPIVWQKPENLQSDFRGGAYAGTIERIDGRGELTLLGRNSRTIKVRLDQLTAIDCGAGENWILDPTGGGPKKYPVCLFEGAQNGPWAINDWGGGLVVRLNEPVLLRSGKTADVFRSTIDQFGAVRVGSGRNQWAAKTGGAATGPDAGRQAKVVPEVGQGYAQALDVGYPATVEAHMSQNDYDTYLFDFPGGTFHAHSASSLDLVADLLDSTGGFMARAQATNGAFRFDRQLAKGRYGLIIRVMNHAGTGPYVLTLGTRAGMLYREQN